MTQIEIDLAKLERGLREGRVKVTRSGKTFWRKQRVGVKEGKEKPEIPQAVKDIVDQLDLYILEYKQEGNTELENDANTIRNLLFSGKENDALKVFQDGKLKYDIGVTYDKLKDYLDEKYIIENFGVDWGTKPGKYEVYRAGGIKGDRRGIFFSIDERGASAYSKGGEIETKKYKIGIKNPLVGNRVEEVYANLIGENVSKIYERKNRAKNVNTFWRNLDAKVVKLAKEKGYDSILYTKPAPPALRELVLFDNKSVTEMI